MELTYIDNFTLTDLECDRFGRLKPSAMLWLVQEMAGRHCDRLGLDWQTLAEKGLFWAIIRHRLQVTRCPKKGETIRIETWPMPTTRVAFPRNVVAFDGAGKELFRSISLWVLMDLQTRAMVLPGKSGVQVPGITLGGELPLPKSLAPAVLSGRQSHQVAFTDLDLNGHMNNCRYLDLAADLLPSRFHRDHTLQDMTLGYLAEAREGDGLQLHYEVQEDSRLHLEITRENSRIFAAEVQYT